MKYCLLPVILFTISCTDVDVLPSNSLEGYAPVYQATTAVKSVSTSAAKNTSSPGKIYAYKTFIYQNDVNNGIHIIDNSNPASPKKVGYINIPFSTEVAVKGDFLYSNNLDDLVVFDISKPAEPKLVNRVADVFPAANQTYPPFFNTVFECADPEKGVVIRWERKTLKDPKCRR